MSFRSASYISSLLIFVLVIGFAALVSQLLDVVSEVGAIAESRYRSYVLADGLRQTSDDLTTMLRLHVVTGDPLYRDYFNEIVDIRNGAAPRPNKYSELPYWNYVLATGERPGGFGAAVSVRTLLDDADFSDRELGLLLEAENRSNELVKLENEILAVVEAEREAGGSEYRLEGTALLAAQRVHGPEYHHSKELVMLPLVELSREVSTSLAAAQKDALGKVTESLWNALVVAGIAIVLGLLTVRAARRRGMSMGSRPVSFTVLTTLTFISSVFWILQVNGEEEYINAILEQKFEIYFLTDGLRQTSDDLTRMARLNVVTGDPVYRKYFDEILAIRNGEIHRPEQYFDVPFWDIVLATETYYGDNGEAVPLLTLIREAGATKEELALLQNSEDASRTLVRLQNDAMDVVAAQREASGGEYRPAGEAIAAIQRLHGTGYHVAEEGVVAPLVVLANTVEETLFAEASHLNERIQQSSAALTASIGLALVFSIGAMSMARQAPV